jgi:protein TonB
MMGMGGGSVALFATIGADGKVRNIHGQFSMSAALTAAALMAVAQWQYKPYLQDGVPVDFDTTINVDFGSGNGRGGGGGPGGRGGGGMPPH